MGIIKADFLDEMKEKWGAPDHVSVVGDTEQYTWLDKKKGILGQLVFDVCEWGPRMNVILYSSTGEQIAPHYSKAKAKDVLK